MKKEFALENFHGPLHLLLELVEEQKMEITDVSLSHVTEQFLQYLQEIGDRLPEELADFLVIATRLLLLKSRALLPIPELEEEHPDHLAAQLRMYKKYADATHAIEGLYMGTNTLYPKKATQLKVEEVVFRPPTDINDQALHDFFVGVLAKLEPVVRIPKVAMEKVVTLREKLAQIQNIIAHNVTTRFHDLIADNRDTAEIVVTFLALLELTKQQTIVVRQESAYAEILVQRAQREQ